MVGMAAETVLEWGRPKGAKCEDLIAPINQLEFTARGDVQLRARAAPTQRHFALPVSVRRLAEAVFSADDVNLRLNPNA